MIKAMLLLAASALLAECAGPQGSAANPPRTQPLGIVSSAPPADTSFVHLRCVPGTDEGPGFTCTRHD